MNITIIKRLTLAAYLLTLTLSVMAIPAKPGLWRTITLADGSTVRVELKGDEHSHYYQALDGRKYQVTSQKLAGLTTDIYAEVTDAQIEEQASNSRLPRKGQLGEQHEPYVGTKKCICILVEYKDVKFSEDNPQEFFSGVVNGVGYSNPEYGYVGSVRDYFREQSYGQLDIEFDVVGPYELPYNRKFYGGNVGGADDMNKVQQMIAYAIDMANPDVNFADYDWDGDGISEAIFVLYAGNGEADSDVEEAIWPHKSVISRKRVDGVYVTDYACGGELNTFNRPTGIGTMCHEYSHCIGLPDIYDAAYGGNYGMGTWDIMDRGCYNNNAYTPVGYNAYERWYAGWMKPVELLEDCTVDAMEAISGEGSNAYIVYNKRNRNEYFLFENRQQTRWDEHLPAAGMLAYHVDFDGNAWAYNLINDTWTQPSITNHPRFQLLAADNVMSLATESGDVYPFAENNAIGDTTLPATTLYNDNYDGTRQLGITISDITRNADGTMAFRFTSNMTRPSRPEGAIFHETFSFNYGEGGNDGIFKTINTSVNPSFDNEGWKADKVYGCNDCIVVGSRMATSGGDNIVSPEITLEEGREYELSFRVAPFYNYADPLSVEIATGNATLTVPAMELTTGQWNDYRTTISGNGPVTVKISRNRAFYLDDILVASTTADAIKTIETSPMTGNSSSYNLMGQQVSPSAKGVLIIGGRKVLKR